MNEETSKLNLVIQEFRNGLDTSSTTADKKPKLTLEQKLKLFDPTLHGVEVIVGKPIGAEIIK